MRQIRAIFHKEILSLMVSPAAYGVLACFLLLGGYIFFSFLAGFNIALAEAARMPADMKGGINLNQWVIERYYHALVFLLVFLAPLLAMRSLTEERRRGTFELLATSPLRPFDIVAGKFLALALVVIIMCGFALLFPVMLVVLAEPEVPPVFAGILGVLLCGLSFVALSMAASCAAESQMIAGSLSIAALLLLYVIFFPAKSLGPGAEAILTYLSPVWQVNDLIKGVLTLKALVYFLSLQSFGLFLCQRILEVRRRR